jgi:hypothetical protein
LIIFIFDSDGAKHHKFWEYICDIVVRLIYTYTFDYFVRTFEIIKARYQPHVWAKYYYKI